jgi:hypothetical protein
LKVGYQKAIGRRRRVLKRAHDRAQRRFHAAIEAGVIFDETARATRLYVEAERLVDAVMAPEVHPTPVAVVVSVLSRDDDGFDAIVNYVSRWDEYQTRGA